VIAQLREVGALLGYLSLIGVAGLAIAYRGQAVQLRLLRERLTGHGHEPGNEADHRRSDSPVDLAAVAAIVLAVAIFVLLLIAAQARAA
jgi:hypothetical protein